jgi:ATP-dependent DNA helicase RecG
VNRVELRELILNGEGSGVEFKRDEVENHELAEEIVAFANLAGGVVLLGVEDDGSIHGTTRPELEEWVMELCRAKIDPPLIPYFSWFRDFEPGKDVAVVQVLTGPYKPYWHVHRGRRRAVIRVGSTNREASTDELERMFQESGRLVYGAKPVPGAGFDELDIRRLRNYFREVRGGELPDSEPAEWERLLVNLELMVETSGVTTPTIDGMLLFGRNPKRFLPQSGIRALAFPGTSADYAARADEDLRGAMLPLLDAECEVVQSGLVEQALDFVRRNTAPQASIEGGRRIDRSAYPPEVLREALVNALVHRDYSIYGTDITLTIFEDRLEIASPGRLPNTVTVEGLREGLRYARNQTLVNLMRDYRYVDFRGMGIRDKMIPGMREHNGTEPEFEERDQVFVVRLLARPGTAAA